MPQQFPIIITVPSLAAGNNIAQVSLGTELRFFEVSAYLRALVSGTYTIRARRNSDNSILGSISFTAPGLKIFTGLGEYMADNDVLCYDITSLGVGASECLMSAWAIIPGT
jgi:hypothetical protein